MLFLEPAARPYRKHVKIDIMLSLAVRPEAASVDFYVEYAAVPTLFTFIFIDFSAAGPLDLLCFRSGSQRFRIEAVNCKAFKPTTHCTNSRGAVAHHPPRGLAAATTNLGDLRR